MAYRRSGGRFTRRSGGSGWRRPPALPTRSTARKIVKRAGPLERSFFLDSTQTAYGQTPGTVYANAESIYDQKVYQVFGPNDYQQDGGSRERVRVSRCSVRLAFVVPRNYTDGEFPVMGNELGLMLVRGPASVLSNYFEAGFGDANPWGTEGSVTAYEQLPREVKVLARKIRIYPAPINVLASGSGGVTPGESTTDIYLAAIQAQRWLSSMEIRAKGFWLQEPESVWLVSYRRCTKSAAQSADEIGVWVGEHTTQVSFARY